MTCCNLNAFLTVRQNNFVILKTNKVRGVSRIFERGGPISLGSLKKRSSDFKRGVHGLKGGGPVNLSHYDDKSCIFRC